MNMIWPNWWWSPWSDVDRGRESAEKQELIDRLTADNKRLREDHASILDRECAFRVLIAALRDCNRKLDERNTQLEGRS